MAIVGMSLPVVVAGLGSALFFAGSSVTKHISAGNGPDAPGLRAASIARFVLATVRHPLWLVGIAADVGGVALQVIALHLGALAVVQPLLLSGLVFAILLRGTVDRHLPLRHVSWAVVLAGALGGFLVLSNGGGSGAYHAVDVGPAVVSTAGGIVLVVLAVFSGARATAARARAALMGVAAGTIYAAAAALLKSVSDLALRGLFPLIAGWQLYALIIVGAAGLLVSQIAFRSGPMSAGLPVASTVDPLLSIVIGVAVFDERMRLGPGHGALLAVLLVVLGVAVLRLAVLGDAGSTHGSRCVRSGAEERSASSERVDEPFAAEHESVHR